VPDIAQLGAFFHLDADDRRRSMAGNGARNQLGWSVQLGTARFLNCVLDDPEDVPAAVVDYVAEQLGLAADVIGDIARERPSPKSRTALPKLRDAGPWAWSAADADAFFAEARDQERRPCHAAQLPDRLTAVLRLITDPYYGWPAELEERFRRAK
jgi:hypothetical protein